MLSSKDLAGQGKGSESEEVRGSSGKWLHIWLQGGGEHRSVVQHPAGEHRPGELHPPGEHRPEAGLDVHCVRVNVMFIRGLLVHSNELTVPVSSFKLE